MKKSIIAALIAVGFVGAASAQVKLSGNGGGQSGLTGASQITVNASGFKNATGGDASGSWTIGITGSASSYTSTIGFDPVNWTVTGSLVFNPSTLSITGIDTMATGLGNLAGGNAQYISQILIGQNLVSAVNTYNDAKYNYMTADEAAANEGSAVVGALAAVNAEIGRTRPLVASARGLISTGAADAHGNRDGFRIDNAGGNISFSVASVVARSTTDVTSVGSGITVGSYSLVVDGAASVLTPGGI